ncbi:MAG: GDP-mannose 4,6-dehydratase, partial [Ferruginibacter sp.]
MEKGKKEILVTGGAGFIGSHLVEKLLAGNYAVTAIDNFDPFYDKSVKIKNMGSFREHPSFTFIEMDILNEAELNEKLEGNYEAIIHLAAKAGVRPSIMNPIAYQDVNVKGTQNMLEFAKNKNIR